MRYRFLKIGCPVMILAFAISLVLAAEPRERFEKEMQEVFAKEAVTSQKFNSAVQTARLLGLIEFMADSSFPLFHRCLKQVRPWRSLSPKEREELLQKCKPSRELATTTEKQTSDSFKAVGDLEIQVHDLNRKIGLLEANLSYKNEQIVEAVNQVRRNLDSLERAVVSLRDKPTAPEQTSQGQTEPHFMEESGHEEPSPY